MIFVFKTFFTFYREDNFFHWSNVTQLVLVLSAVDQR